MIHLTLAIADFMMILIMAAMWGVGWIVGAVALAGAAVGGLVYAGRRFRRRR